MSEQATIDAFSRSKMHARRDSADSALIPCPNELEELQTGEIVTGGGAWRAPSTIAADVLS